MKNIFQLPVEQSSLILDESKKLHFNPNNVKFASNGLTKPQHIYIISEDKKLNQGDYFIWQNSMGELQVFKFHSDAGYGIKTYSNFNEEDGSSRIVKWSGAIGRIVLTTDEDLIKDGIENIDGNFLNWFVKNPTCEYVKINPLPITKPTTYDQPDLFLGYKYELIIPKKETLQDIVLYNDNIPVKIRQHFIDNTQKTLTENGVDFSVDYTHWLETQLIDLLKKI